jgi:glutathione S-transferase
MLKIYAIPASLYCAKLRILLRHNGLQWRQIPPPGGYGSDEYKAVVPSGNLPALQEGDLQIADSEAIAEYLNEIHPDPAMLPGAAPARGKVRERARFHDTRLEPLVRALFPHMPGRAPAPDGFVRKQSSAISVRLEQLAHLLEATPDAGQPLTLADCGYPVTFCCVDAMAPALGLDITWPRAVVTYRTRIEAHRAVTVELAQYRPRVEAFFNSGVAKPAALGSSGA